MEVNKFNISNLDPYARFTVLNSTCMNVVLESNQSCTLDILSDTANATSATLNLLNEKDEVLGTLPITINTPVDSVQSVGGCSAVKDGDDYSLIFILGGLLITWFYYKRRNN